MIYKNITALVTGASGGLGEEYVHAVVALTHAFVPDMIASRRGGLINIASTASFQPLAGAAVYAASKAFVLLFSEALSLELEKTGVRVLVACPGPVATQFFADMQPSLEAKQMDQPRPVVTEILRAFENGKRVVYPGKITVRLSTWGARLMPRNLILRLAAGTVKRLNQKQRLLRKLLTATGLGKIDEVPGYNRACLGCSSRLAHQEFEFKSGQRRWNQCLTLLGSSAVTSR